MREMAQTTLDKAKWQNVVLRLLRLRNLRPTTNKRYCKLLGKSRTFCRH